MAPKFNLKDKIDDGEIDLSMCDLQDVPIREIANTKNIYSLDLSNNHLVTLPKNFATLKFLTKLDLSKNSLKELPENFGELTKLKHLDLYKNELQHLPLSFSKLKALRWLDLKDNPLVPAIREISGPCLDSKQCLQCAKSVVQFYTELQEKVEVEKEMREKNRQKDLQATELKQKAEKKNKKKEKKQKSTEDTVKTANIINNETIVNEGPYTSDNSKPPVKRTGICGAVFSFALTIVMHAMLFISLLFLLTSLQLDLTKELERRVVSRWSYFVREAPKLYQPYLNDFSAYFQIVHTKTGDIIYIGVYYVRQLAEKVNTDNIVYVFERLKNFYYDLFKVK